MTRAAQAATGPSVISGAGGGGAIVSTGSNARSAVGPTSVEGSSSKNSISSLSGMAGGLKGREGIPGPSGPRRETDGANVDTFRS